MGPYCNHCNHLSESGLCKDCGKATMRTPDFMDEYYMITEELWAMTGLKPHDGFLCITCLEKRIGRQLTSDDFTDVYVNQFPFFPSDILLNRLGSKVKGFG
jgi:hypothetical protein